MRHSPCSCSPPRRPSRRSLPRSVPPTPCSRSDATWISRPWESPRFPGRLPGHLHPPVGGQDQGHLRVDALDHERRRRKARFLSKGSNPVWSPDGTRIAFMLEGEPGVVISSTSATWTRRCRHPDHQVAEASGKPGLVPGRQLDRLQHVCPEDPDWRIDLPAAPSERSGPRRPGSSAVSTIGPTVPVISMTAIPIFLSCPRPAARPGRSPGVTGTSARERVVFRGSDLLAAGREDHHRGRQRCG